MLVNWPLTAGRSESMHLTTKYIINSNANAARSIYSPVTFDSEFLASFLALYILISVLFFVSGGGPSFMHAKVSVNNSVAIIQERRARTAYDMLSEIVLQKNLACAPLALLQIVEALETFSEAKMLSIASMIPGMIINDQPAVSCFVSGHLKYVFVASSFSNATTTTIKRLVMVFSCLIIRSLSFFIASTKPARAMMSIRFVFCCSKVK